MYSSLFPRDLFAEVERLQREMQQAFDPVSPSIRGFARGYPALNVGSTPNSVEVYAFAPGIDPANIEINLERGVLTIEGERARPCPPTTARPRCMSTSVSKAASAACSACPTTSTLAPSTPPTATACCASACSAVNRRSRAVSKCNEHRGVPT